MTSKKVLPTFSGIGFPSLSVSVSISHRSHRCQKPSIRTPSRKMMARLECQRANWIERAPL